MTGDPNHRPRVDEPDWPELGCTWCGSLGCPCDRSMALCYECYGCELCDECPRTFLSPPGEWEWSYPLPYWFPTVRDEILEERARAARVKKKRKAK